MYRTMQQELVVETLLSAVNMEAHLSLEPVLMLLGTLARDLQADYLPFLPKIVDALSTVLEQGAAPHYLTLALPRDKRGNGI